MKINLWSGPRNVSTALMYSFAERADTEVVDEPLYGHYLTVSGADHPGRAEVIASMNCDGNGVMRRLQNDVHGSSVVFAKQMAHHLIGIDPDLLLRMKNVFLIRDPRDMLPSLTVQLPDASLRDTGLETQCELLRRLLSAGQQAVVIDSRLLLENPERVLKRLCEQLNIDFDERMLSWSAGARPEDGIWAKYWYHAVHRSTGFQRYRPKPDFPPRLESLLAECLPYYDELFTYAREG